MDKVLFVGICPSDKSPDNSSFHENTKSGKVLRAWIESIDIDLNKIDYYNIIPYKTTQTLSRKHLNLPLITQDIVEVMAPKKVVALGKFVSVTLEHLGIEHLAFDHPSGMNRKLNNKQYLEDRLKELKEYLCDQPSIS